MTRLHRATDIRDRGAVRMKGHLIDGWIRRILRRKKGGMALSTLHGARAWAWMEIDDVVGLNCSFRVSL